MVVDHQSAHDQIDGFDNLSTEQRAAARRTVAHYSQDVNDCRELLEMLGIAPSQERDDPPEVNRPRLPKSTPKRRNLRPTRA